MAADGININPAHKGIFTEKAKRHNMSVQEFASYVLANKDKFPSDTVKQANFARNAVKWHKQDGGQTIPYDPSNPASLTQYYNQYAANNVRIQPNSGGFEIQTADGTLKQVSREGINDYLKIGYKPITYKDSNGVHTIIKPNGVGGFYQDGGAAVPEAYIPTTAPIPTDTPTMDFHGNPTYPGDDEVQRKREKWKNQYYHYRPITPYNDHEEVYRTAGDIIKNILIHGKRRKRDIARSRNITRVFDGSFEDGGYVDIFEDGGYIEADLTPQEIEMLKKAGYNVEEI